jgi:hypothetical protein
VPIERCELPDGGDGYRWGASGTCYRNRADAEKQAQAAYANGYNGDAAIAFDRASVRRYDQDGHLFVEDAIISAACVSDYLGDEIPDGEKLGFRKGQVYPLLRDPAALAESAPSFAGKPLLLIHRPVSAEDHPHKIVIGAIGSDVRYKAPHLRASLSVWDRDAIRLIESGEQKSLSCGYYYRCVKEDGVFDGQPFQGRMLDIQGNHCAIVTTPRVQDAVIGDSAIPLLTIPEIPVQPEQPMPPAALEQDATPTLPQEPQIMATRHVSMSRQALLASGALRAYLRPKLAADAKIDLNPILQPVTVKNWADQKPKIAAALDAALKDKLAKDADLADLLGMLDALEDVPEPVAADAESDDEDDEDDKKRKAKEAAEKLKEAAADAESDDDDDAESDDDEDDDEEEKKRKAKEAAVKLKEAADRKAAKDRRSARDKAKGMDAQPMVTKAAMDAAIASAVRVAADQAAKNAEASTIARLNAIHEAREDVRPIVGALAGAMDSADAVYKVALEGLQAKGFQVDVSKLTPATYGAVFQALKPVAVAAMDAKPVAKTTRIAADSATLTARQAMFPNANRLSGAH